MPAKNGCLQLRYEYRAKFIYQARKGGIGRWKSQNFKLPEVQVEIFSPTVRQQKGVEMKGGRLMRLPMSICLFAV